MKNKKLIKGYMKVKPWMLKDFAEIEKEKLEWIIKKMKDEPGVDRNS